MFSLILPLSPAAAWVMPFFLTLLASASNNLLFCCPSPRTLALLQFQPVLFLLSYMSLDATWRTTTGATNSQEENYPHFHIHNSSWSKENAVTLKIRSAVVVPQPGSTKCIWHLQKGNKLQEASTHYLNHRLLEGMFLL